MKETITVLQIIDRLDKQINVIKKAIESQDMDKLRNECVCSLIGGDENIIINPVLDENLGFNFNEYYCELTFCNSLICSSQIMELNDHTDRYVCWIRGHRDLDGKTLDEYLKDNPGETREENYWIPKVYLVPEVWSYGAESDLKPGTLVDKIILEGIDKFLSQYPNI